MKRLPPIALLLAACGGTPTELIVVVDTDLAVPSELSAVRAVVRSQDAMPTSLNDFILDGPDPIAVPFSFVVVPIDGDAGRRITLELSALDADRISLFVRSAQTGFAENKRLLLPLFLAASCRTETCPPEQRPPDSLEEVEAGEEIP